MVPRLHQRNARIKMKLEVWRVQKCIPIVRANTALTGAYRQTTPSLVSQYRAENENLRKFGSIFRYVIVLAPKQCLNHKRKLQVWRVHKCIPLVGATTALTCAYRQTTPSQVSQYRVENKHLRKSGSTFRQGTVFAPKERLY